MKAIDFEIDFEIKDKKLHVYVMLEKNIGRHEKFHQYLQ